MKSTNLSLVLRVLGVLMLVVLAWRRAAASDSSDALSWVGAAVVIGLVVLGVWWWTHRADQASRGVGAARPGWRTQVVWADETLASALTQLGVTARKMRGGTRLTLAWSGPEVELWRGAALLVTLPWTQVRTITRTTGRAASTGNPAVELVTHDSVALVVVPTRQPAGGMLPATAQQVDGLVTDLRTAREVGAASSTPPANS